MKSTAADIAEIQRIIAEAIERGEPVAAETFFNVKELADIAGAFNRHGFAALAPVHEALGGAVDYGRLKVFRAMVNAGK